MFQNYIITKAALLSAIIAGTTMLIGTILWVSLSRYCKKHNKEDAQEISKTEKTTVSVLRLFVLILFAVSGLYIGNVINISSTYYTAIKHGMTPNSETNKYDLKYGEVIALNKTSVEETDIDENDMKGRLIIYVRYDCPDCMILHDQIAELADHNFIFLSSRTQKGKNVRELYNIDLTEVPQAVYINHEGIATVATIMTGSGKDLAIDYEQIKVLKKMADHDAKVK